LKQLVAALLRAATSRHPQTSLPIAQHTPEPISVFVDKRAHTGREINLPDVVPAGIAVIEAKQHPAREIR
jgi:hypothetical protein